MKKLILTLSILGALVLTPTAMGGFSDGGDNPVPCRSLTDCFMMEPGRDMPRCYCPPGTTVECNA